MIIRTEDQNDYKQINEINCLAFKKDSDDLVERIRCSDEYIKQLSLVAEMEGVTVGHVMFSKGILNNGTIKETVLTLGPIAVKPEFQKQGIGSALINEGLKRCKELGFHLVFLIGHQTYYPKFGFRPARKEGFELKQFDVPDEVFMVCELTEGAVETSKGELFYSNAFIS